MFEVYKKPIPIARIFQHWNPKEGLATEAYQEIARMYGLFTICLFNV